MRTLTKEQRNQLAKTVMEARDAAEVGARKALHALGVDESDAPPHLTQEQRELRRALRAQARQLGDGNDLEQKGKHSVKHLTEKIAYDQWHRMLFARFLAENNLLISPQHQIAVTLDECNDLAPEFGLRDGWQVATQFAAEMLPQIFRIDDPAGQILLASEDRLLLQQYIANLQKEIFLSDDAIGWVYQFWQAKRKDEVNSSEKKIGADELAPVTQIFTEDYMVQFLLDNTLGAWWFSKRSKEEKKEMTLEVKFPFLRTLGDKTPAAGTFDKWPKTSKELRILDPCMGSGHFLSFALPILASFRIEEEGLSITDAYDAVLKENLYGLELDQRCTQIGVFNLAMKVWKETGYRPLPTMNIACCGQGINASKDDWLKLANGDERILIGMDKLYILFQQAPMLGSLIDPKRIESSQLRSNQRDLFTAGFHELQPLLKEALNKERVTKDVNQEEIGVIAQGLAKAADMLATQYTLVVTNVPYLGRGKQDEILRNFCDSNYPEAKNDLATVFLERCMELCEKNGTSSTVIPQNWLFLSSYHKFREKLLKHDTWHLIVRLGPHAFETINGEIVKVILIILSKGKENQSYYSDGKIDDNFLFGIDVSESRTAQEKAVKLVNSKIIVLNQRDQLANSDARIILDKVEATELLSKYASSYQGVTTGDNPRFIFYFWEVNGLSNPWKRLQSVGDSSQLYSGRERVFLWEDGKGYLANSDLARIQGQSIWNKNGVAVRQMNNLPVTLNNSSPWDMNCATIVPNNPEDLPAIWCFCSSSEYNDIVRQIDQNLKVTNATLVKVPFDIKRWKIVASEEFPAGLPKARSDDPTQWIFHGHPAQSDNPLQVAVARLLGYCWPLENDCSLELSDEAHELLIKSKALQPYADKNGIMCVNGIKGERPASERLSSLMSVAYGTDWNSIKQTELLSDVDFNTKTIEDWLRNGFFEQHCMLFHQRPFIWQIWDGRKDGFSALVNYHKLDKPNLEKLTYTYLNDWIMRQKAAIEMGEEGSDERLSASLMLKGTLEKIIEGEPPYDIFARWKPIEQQPIGWEPDLNDGVRINIRPFMEAGILRKNPKINWNKDRGKDSESAPWYHLFKGERINDHHLTLEEKRRARERRGLEG